MKIGKTHFGVINTTMSIIDRSLTGNFKWYYKSWDFMLYFGEKTKHISIWYWLKKVSKENYEEYRKMGLIK